MTLIDCPCGCGERFEPGPRDRLYATAACKTRAYRDRHQSPHAARVTSQVTVVPGPCGPTIEAAPEPVRDGRGCPGGPRSGPNARSGATVSAGRMVHVLCRRLNLSEPSAVSVVMDAMTINAQARWKRPA